MSKKGWFYIIFFSILTIFFLYFSLKDYDFSRSKLTVINDEIPEFTFLNQDGKQVSQRNTEDKVYVAEYFFTTCKGICPKMNANMRRVYETFKEEKDFMILSHTCMPEIDSVPVLKEYEQKVLKGKLVRKDDGTYRILDPKDTVSVASNTNWHFLTGSKRDLYKLARQGYMIDNGKPDSTQNLENEFIHTQFFALVDRNGRVRAIYDGLIEEEVDKLMTDIRGLLKEKVSTKRFMTGFSNNPG